MGGIMRMSIELSEKKPKDLQTILLFINRYRFTQVRWENGYLYIFYRFLTQI